MLQLKSKPMLPACLPLSPPLSHLSFLYPAAPSKLSSICLQSHADSLAHPGLSQGYKILPSAQLTAPNSRLLLVVTLFGKVPPHH